MDVEQSLEMTESEMMDLLPGFFERFFAFFEPAHREGIVPSRIKELARLKIAAINECDT
jgi:hypothetical protein